MNLEQLFAPFMRGPSLLKTTAGNGQFAGRATINSGSAFATVSTAVVNSDSIFRLATVVGSVGQTASSGGAIVVNSVVSGTSFALARQYGQAIQWNDTVCWEIVRTTDP